MSIKDTLDREILTLHEINYFLEANIDFILYRHTGSQSNLIELNKRLIEYTTTNKLIASINYVNLTTNQSISSNIPTFKQGDHYELYFQGQYIPFDLDKYIPSTDTHQLIFLEEDGSETAIYLPKSVKPEYCIFYVLDITELYEILTPAPNSGITSVCLLNADGNIVVEYCQEVLQKYMDEPISNAGYHSINSDNIIFTTAYITGNCRLGTVISNHEIVHLVDHAMRNTYLLLMALSAAGFLLIIFAMQTTFMPLHKLVQHLLPKNTVSSNHNYTELLRNAFSTMSSENQLFREKLLSYRLFMQKSILDAEIFEGTNASVQGIDLDYLFNQDIMHYILIIKIVNFSENPDFVPLLKNSLKNNLPGSQYATVTFLEENNDSIVLLISYAGTLPKDPDFISYFYQLYTSLGCRIAISSTTCSPLEIPALYKNITTITDMLAESPVISYSELSRQIPDSNNLHYPFALLEDLQFQLHNYQYQEAKSTINRLLEILDHITETNEHYAEFFIRCVLIDILTTLANIINEMNIKFQTYNDLYFSTLYLCRGGSYTEIKDDIHCKFIKFFDLIEDSNTSVFLNVSMIQHVMNQEYASPDFSITELADKLHVSSVQYMSLLFKKHLNVNFSDYLWNMRLEKAKSLLIYTDMTVEQISVSVGYLNVSSFRRKFKQEVGVTPSQYREKR